MNRSSKHRRGLWLAGTVGLATLLAGCTTFGGNVRGKFSCAAPDGMCAPSATIDDRALALLSDDPTTGDPQPARQAQSSSSRSRRTPTIAPARTSPADPRRSQEKVLRIVFQPYIDERGRFHEASAVRAVVASGEWQEQARGDTAPLSGSSAAALPTSTPTLADALDHADPALEYPGAADPSAPDPAAVAAARARKVDPVDAIKADVGSRLTPKSRAAGRPGPSASAAPVPPAPATPGLTSGGQAVGPSGRLQRPASAPAIIPSRSSGPTTPTAVISASGKAAISAAGREAAARVKSDPRYQDAVRQTAPAARDAARQTGGGATPAGQGTTIKSANFPAAVPEDN